MNKGYIKLFRKFTEWEWYDDINTKILFLHLLLRVNYEDKEWRGILIKKGQIVTSIYKLAEETGLSIQNVRTSIAHLKSTHELTHETTHNYSVITLVNWGKYQCDDISSNTRTNTLSNKSLTHTKEYKEIKNKKNNNIVHFDNARDTFDILWNLYPNKCGKANAFKKYQKVRGKVDDETIKRGIIAYNEYIAQNNVAKQYVKHGATWFNQECWNDVYEASDVENVEEKNEVDNKWKFQ